MRDLGFVWLCVPVELTGGERKRMVLRSERIEVIEEIPDSKECLVQMASGRKLKVLTDLQGFKDRLVHYSPNQMIEWEPDR